MFQKEIMLTAYEVNNIELLFHIMRENGCVCKVFRQGSATIFAINEDRYTKAFDEYTENYNKLFLFCERYKYLKLPHLAVARQKKLRELINLYNLQNKYRVDYTEVLEELRVEDSVKEK